VSLRGYLTSYGAYQARPRHILAYSRSLVNCCWGIGLTIGAAVVRASLTIEGSWGEAIYFYADVVADSTGWRMPYVIQWVWPIPLFTLVLFAPESKSPFLVSL
jgi:SP family general alpha glucoside:H+ symporter-like MFS transporter